MKIYTFLRLFLFSGIFMVFTSHYALGQVTFGAGFSGMKYYGVANQRPIAVGMNASVGIELSSKSRLVLEPTFFIPVKYSYNQTFNINNIPSVNSNEQLKTVEAAALYQYDLIGNNKGGGVFYLAACPALMIYNANVTRDNATTYNYQGSFRDYMFDARAGLEIPFLIFLKLFAEVEVNPRIATDFKSNQVDYKPNTGSVMAASIGLKIHL